jgi:SulP family sulfate permease
VREDTAELASFALSDKASVRSAASPPRRSAQTNIESYFHRRDDSDSTSNREVEGLQHHIIQEVSEPVSPEEDTVDKSPRTSVLTDLLKRCPPNGLPPGKKKEEEDESSEDGEGDDVEVDSSQGRLIITSEGLKMDATERTPLITKTQLFETHHPDWIRGQRDIEAQETRRRGSWPNLRSIMLWPKRKGYDIVKVIVNPKAW